MSTYSLSQGYSFDPLDGSQFNYNFVTKGNFNILSKKAVEGINGLTVERARNNDITLGLAFRDINTGISSNSDRCPSYNYLEKKKYYQNPSTRWILDIYNLEVNGSKSQSILEEKKKIFETSSNLTDIKKSNSDYISQVTVKIDGIPRSIINSTNLVIVKVFDQTKNSTLNRLIAGLDLIMTDREHRGVYYDENDTTLNTMDSTSNSMDNTSNLDVINKRGIEQNVHNVDFQESNKFEDYDSLYSTSPDTINLSAEQSFDVYIIIQLLVVGSIYLLLEISSNKPQFILILLCLIFIAIPWLFLK